MAANVERRQIGEQFKVIDPARVPERPFSPDRSRLYWRWRRRRRCCSGSAWSALIEFRDTTFRTEQDVVTVLALPVLATVPAIVTVDRAADGAPEAPHRGVRSARRSSLVVGGGGRLEISRRARRGGADVRRVLRAARTSVRSDAEPALSVHDARASRGAHDDLEYGISGRKGITLLIGAAGTGKTTLVQAALRDAGRLNVDGPST